MTYMLPIVFTFLFYKMPSGLVLYWLVNTVLSIAQQYYINKGAKDGAPAAPAEDSAAAPAAKPAGKPVRRQGGSKNKKK